MIKYVPNAYPESRQRCTAQRETRYTLVGTLCATLVLMLLQGCKKEVSDADQWRLDLGDTPVAYIQDAGQVMLGDDTYNFTYSHAGIPIRRTASASSDLTVEAYIDPTLINTYNEAFQERYGTFAAEAFQVSHSGRFTIPSGATESADSLYIELHDGSALTDSTTYLVPVRLRVGSGDLRASLFFFKVFFTKRKLEAELMPSGLLNNEASGALDMRAGSEGYVFRSWIFGKDEFVASEHTELKIGVRINNTFPQDTQAEVVIRNDEATVKGIDEWAYPFPEGTYELTKATVTIPAGQTSSRDSIVIRMINKHRFSSEFPTNNCILPFEIRSNPEGAFKVPASSGARARGRIGVQLFY